MKENKEIRKRAIKAIDDIKKLREKKVKTGGIKYDKLINPTTHLQSLLGGRCFILEVLF